MRVFRVLLMLGLIAGLILLLDAGVNRPPGKMRIGTDTTYVTEPLDSEGLIDYEAAANRWLKGSITADNNAVVLLMRGFGPRPEGANLRPEFFEWLGIDRPLEEGDYFVPHQIHFKEETRRDDPQPFYDLEQRLQRGPWKPSDSPKHAEWLKINDKPLAVFTEASRRDHYYLPMIARKPDGKRELLLMSLLPTVQACRQIATAFSLRATLKLTEGQIDEALDDILTIHRLGRLLTRGGSLIELLVGIAFEAIAHKSEETIFEHGRPTAKQALTYQAALLSLPANGSAAEKVGQFERLMILDSLQSLSSEKFKDFPGLEHYPKENFERETDPVVLEAAFLTVNRWVDRIEKVLNDPNRVSRHAELEKIDSELKALRDEANNLIRDFSGEERGVHLGAVFTVMLVPGFQKIADALDRIEQTRRNAVVVTALAAYRAEHGRYPDDLRELERIYLPIRPLDLYSPAADLNGRGNFGLIRYRRVGNGYLLYSVGPNGKDDDGKLFGDQPPGDDIGVRFSK